MTKLYILLNDFALREIYGGEVTLLYRAATADDAIKFMRYAMVY